MFNKTKSITTTNKQQQQQNTIENNITTRNYLQFIAMNIYIIYINYIRYKFVVQSFCQKGVIIAIIADHARTRMHNNMQGREVWLLVSPFNSIQTNTNK